MQQSHIERAKVSLEGRRVTVLGENPACVYFVVGQRDPGAKVPLDELPTLGSVASLVLDVPPVNPWRRSTWPTGAARTWATAELIPFAPTRQRDEATHGCAVRCRYAWSESEQRVRALNCICGHDPLPAGGTDALDPLDERVVEDRKMAAAGPDRD